MKKMEWYRLLSPSLLQSAYKFGSGLAWPKSQALSVANLLNTNGYVILGVDSWLPRKTGPIPLICDWNINQHMNSDKIPNTPVAFIQQFEAIHPLQAGKDTLFSFCVK